jgi:hypothetical protein
MPLGLLRINFVTSHFSSPVPLSCPSSTPHQAAKGNFLEKPYWGCDLASEHERYITEQVFKKPVILINYPKDIKAFYMKLNPDNKTVAAMDVLVPKIGEIIGGSQREDDYGESVYAGRMDEWLEGLMMIARRRRCSSACFVRGFPDFCSCPFLFAPQSA